MDPNALAPHELCYELDRLCPGYWFTFSGVNRIEALLVFSGTDHHNNRLAKFIVDDDNPIEYVITKALLQFSDGTPNA